MGIDDDDDDDAERSMVAVGIHSFHWIQLVMSSSLPA